MDAWSIPFASQDHHRTAHGRDAGRIGDGLSAGLLIGFLMVADVIDVIMLFLAILLAGEDAADVGFAMGAWAEGGWIWEEGFEELDRDDLHAVIGDGFRGEHADVFEAAHMIEVALAEGHEEADLLDFRVIEAKGFDLFVVEEVHIFQADAVEVIGLVDGHRLDAVPFVVFPVSAWGRDFAEVDLRIEVGREFIAMVAAVAVEDVEGVDDVEFMFLGIGDVGLGDARVKAAAEDAGLFEFLAVGPLEWVIEIGIEAFFGASLVVILAEFRLIDVFWLISRGVEVMDLAAEAGFHQDEVMIWHAHMDEHIRLIGIHEGHHFLQIAGIDLAGRDLALGGRLQPLLERVAFAQRPGGDADLLEDLWVLGALDDADGRDAATSDDQYSCHSFSFPVNPQTNKRARKRIGNRARTFLSITPPKKALDQSHLFVNILPFTTLLTVLQVALDAHLMAVK